MTNTDKAYLAGLIDGEGSICLAKEARNSQYRFPSLAVASTSKELLIWVKKVTGVGWISQKRKKQKKHHKDAFCWAIRGRAVIKILKQIEPHLKENKKIARARIILNKYDVVTKRNGKYSEEESETKFQFEDDFFSIT